MKHGVSGRWALLPTRLRSKWRKWISLVMIVAMSTSEVNWTAQKILRSLASNTCDLKVKGSGNIVLNPAVVTGEGEVPKQKKEGQHVDRVYGASWIVAQGGEHLREAAQFAAGTRQLAHCGSN